jgi:Lrp/AsnC family leucine-responsive transcriptional regulator
VLGRIRRLEQARVIVKYETRLDAKLLGFGLTAFILVRSEEAVGSHEGGEKLTRIPGVQEVHYLAGDFHYWLKVRVGDTDGLARILEGIGAVPGIRDTRTTLVLSTIKESLLLPLGSSQAQAAGQATARGRTRSSQGHRGSKRRGSVSPPKRAATQRG